MKILNWVRQLITKKPIIHYIYINTNIVADKYGTIRKKFIFPTGNVNISKKARRIIKDTIDKLENINLHEDMEIIVSKNEKIVVKYNYYNYYENYVNSDSNKYGLVMKFSIPTGEISAEEAKKALVEQMNRYKEDINFEEATGEITIDRV